MQINYFKNGPISPQEMHDLAARVGEDHHRPAERNKKAIDGSLFIATARVGETLIGMVRLIGDGAYYIHLTDFFVDPDYQNRGVGTKLLDICLNFAKEIQVGTGDHYGEFTLFTTPEAVKFYEEKWFRLVPNGMCLTDSQNRAEAEDEIQKYFNN